MIQTAAAYETRSSSQNYTFSKLTYLVLCRRIPYRLLCYRRSKSVKLIDNFHLIKWENSNQKSLGSINIEIQVLVEAFLFKKARQERTSFNS